MSKEHLIYGLVDPRDGQLRYVGKSCSGMARSRAHLTPTELKESNHKARWIRSLLKENLSPFAIILHLVGAREILAEAEVFWIAYFKAMGCPLTNLSGGGEGGRLGVPHSEETKAKLRARALGRVISEETKSKMSASHKSRPWTPEHRANHAASLKGNQHVKGRHWKVEKRGEPQSTIIPS
jgi:hypothetical protein